MDSQKSDLACRVEDVRRCLMTMLAGWGEFGMQPAHHQCLFTDTYGVLWCRIAGRRRFDVMYHEWQIMSTWRMDDWVAVCLDVLLFHLCWPLCVDYRSST